MFEASWCLFMKERDPPASRMDPHSALILPQFALVTDCSPPTKLGHVFLPPTAGVCGVRPPCTTTAWTSWPISGATWASFITSSSRRTTSTASTSSGADTQTSTVRYGRGLWWYGRGLCLYGCGLCWYEQSHS